MRLFITSLALMFITGCGSTVSPAHAATNIVQAITSTGAITTTSGLAACRTKAGTAICRVASTLDASFSNISSASVPGGVWGASSPVLEVVGGQGLIQNTTKLDLTGAKVAFPDNAPVFAGSGAVVGLKESRMTWFGVIGDYIVNGAINGSPTDNKLKIQRAFDSSKVIHVDSGYYYSSAAVSLPRYGQLIALNRESTHLISAANVLYQPVGLDNIYVEGIRFDSTGGGVALDTGTPPGADYSSDNIFKSCVFGNSLSYVLNGKAQRLILDDSESAVPLSLVDGNYLTLRGKTTFIFNDKPTAARAIAGVIMGSAGSAYFTAPAVSIISGHSPSIDNTWFEHIPSAAIFIGNNVASYAITNSKFERVSNATNSQSTTGGGWYINLSDTGNILLGGVISGNDFIGNVGAYSDGTAFTPDTLGVIGGLGVKKSVVIGNAMGFFETAKAPAGGWKMSQYRPAFAQANTGGIYGTSGGYSLADNPSIGRVGAFSAVNSALNTFAAGAPTKAELSTEDFDTDEWYTAASSRYQPSVSGVYRLSAYCWLDTMADGKTAYLMLYKNGSLYRYFDRRSNGAATNMFLSGTLTVRANGTDYFEVYVTQNDTGSISTIALPEALHFEGGLVGY